MNTRLQVEHPVTECVTGLDLVRWQLSSPRGAAAVDRAPAGARARDRGAAVRRGPGPRLAPGHRHAAPLRRPDAATAFATTSGAGVRLDSAVDDGSVVSIHYDPMLAKVIAWAPTRVEAARALAAALARARLHGVVTNRDLLVRVLREAEFLDGGTDTAYLARHPEVFAPLLTGDEDRLAYLAAALAGRPGPGAGSAWAGFPIGWRNVRPVRRRRRLRRPTARSRSATPSTATGHWSTGPTASSSCRSRRMRSRWTVAGVTAPLRRPRRSAGVSYVDGPLGSLAAVDGAAVRPAGARAGARAPWWRRCRARSGGSSSSRVSGSRRTTCCSPSRR